MIPVSKQEKSSDEVFEIIREAQQKYDVSVYGVDTGYSLKGIDLGSRFSFPLRQHHALRYTEPGMALIGDAAHTIHPLAGQGANLGFADAAALASEINVSMRARSARTSASDRAFLS